MYTIEKGIPVPSIKKPHAEGLAAALRRMEKGDSILIPTEHVNRSSVLSTANRLGLKVTSRTVDEKAFRVWRTE